RARRGSAVGRTGRRGVPRPAAGARSRRTALGGAGPLRGLLGLWLVGRGLAHLVPWLAVSVGGGRAGSPRPPRSVRAVAPSRPLVFHHVGRGHEVDQFFDAPEQFWFQVGEGSHGSQDPPP